MAFGEIIREVARKFPKSTSIVFQERRFTFQDTNERVNRLANALLQSGFTKGERAAILSLDCHEFLETVYALSKIGAIVVPLNYMLNPKDLIYMCNNAGVKATFVGRGYHDLVKSFKKELPDLQRYISFVSAEGMESYDALLDSAGSQEPQVKIEGQDNVAICYTSGTTGLPKGVVLTHDYWSRGPGILGSALGYRDHGVYYSGLPLFHASGIIMTTSAIYNGNSVVLLERFEVEKSLEIMEKEHVTHTFFIPSMINFMLDSPSCKTRNLSNLRMVNYGGTPFPPDVLKRSFEVLKCNFIQGYGMTEGGSTFLNEQDHLMDGSAKKLKRLRSVGRPIADITVKVVDDQDREVPQGEIGELVFRGPTMLKEYWKMPEATAEALRNGYFHTGDLGYMDDEGYFYVVDRKKDTITTGGETVYPNDVEAIIYSHPAILEAAVIGIPDPEKGEKVIAVVALKKDKQVSADEILDFCRGKLKENQVPQFVEFLNLLPRNASGKVLKTDLRKKYFSKI
ncbi:MAG: long-chain-fatty-acid--CoA ligase [Candidatus Tectomicrobia bacterium]|uniref:Long-chain-fatty-acid--CoA ligase n=1 Tax=Tectimicrobiota bacterium TaxID=2528274 RepID=A0A933GLE5_UNCTE|nr:long-chain-fatty-acid--CoA ligase [Candidatus Tectomicrobia bacterium]